MTRKLSKKVLRNKKHKLIQSKASLKMMMQAILVKVLLKSDLTPLIIIALELKNKMMILNL